MRKLLRSLALSATFLAAAPAFATPFTASIPDSIGPYYGSGGPISYYFGNVTAPGESGINQALLTFELIGYGGIDGYGPRINNNDVFDDFSFRTGWGATTRNGTSVDTYFSAVLNLGGANPGTPLIVNSLGNATITSYIDNGPGKGGLARFAVPFTLLTGNNTFVFQYGCCSPQNGHEEGWGIRNINITADIAPVPEPAESAMLLAGLGVMAAIARRRRKPLPA